MMAKQLRMGYIGSCIIARSLHQSYYIIMNCFPLFYAHLTQHNLKSNLVSAGSSSSTSYPFILI